MRNGISLKDFGAIRVSELLEVRLGSFSNLGPPRQEMQGRRFAPFAVLGERAITLHFAMV